MKSTATLLDDVGQAGDRVPLPRRARNLTLAGAACAIAAAALTVGAIHYGGHGSVRVPARSVQQGTNVLDSVAGPRSRPEGSGDAPLAATDSAADDRAATEVDSAAAIARLHDLREERESARVVGATDSAAEATRLAGSSD